MRMTTVALLLMAGAALTQEEPQITHLRHGHTLIIPVRAGQEVAATLHAIRASVGYDDPLAYQLMSPRGTSEARGRIAPGEQEIVQFRAEADGAYLLSLDPQMNACAVEGVPYVIDLGDERLLEVISKAQPIYFRVPEGLRRFELDCQGEAATATVLGPDGEVIVERELPQYERVKLRVDVPPGAGGKIWSLRLRLAEDQGIRFDPALPALVSPWPEALAQVEAIGQRAGFVKFDGRLAAETELTLTAVEQPALAVAGGELSLQASPDGQIAEVQVDGARLGPGKMVPLSGLFVRDFASGELEAGGREVRQDGDALVFESRLKTLKLEVSARCEPAADHLRFSARVRDLTGEDRTLTLYFGVPVAAEELTWWDDLDHSRPVTSATELGKLNRTPFGAIGRHSQYTWAAVGSPRGAVACGIPLNQPRLHRLAYNRDLELLYLAWDLALVPETRKFPSAAEVEFVLYAADPQWGFRSAAERYYGIFPDAFEKRMEQDGSWVCWRSLEKMDNVERSGARYHWGPSPSAVKFDNEHGIHAFLYNDSVRYFADVGEFDHKPSRDEANAVFEQYLSADDPAAFVLSRPEKATGRARYVGLQKQWGEEQAAAYLRRCVAAVKASAARDDEGRTLSGYIINRKDWGPENWWTGRLYCNPDPDIAGGYGRFLIEEIIGKTFAELEATGARYDGVGLDNYFVYAQYPDCRRDHFAHVDHPLCFLQATGAPAIVGDFALYEWVEALAEWLRPEGRYIIANTCGLPYPFAAYLLDIHGLEWNLERTGMAARVTSYHKPVVTLPVKPEHYEEPFIKQHVRWAIIPGGYGGKAALKAAPIYEKYLPVLLKLAGAGWEPVTHARSSDEDIKLERFGNGQVFYLTAVNDGEDTKRAEITVDLRALGCEVEELRATALLTGADVDVTVAEGTARCTVSIEAGDVMALEFVGR